MAETYYHLLHDVGMYKSAVKRYFEDNDRGPEFDDVCRLLGERRQTYTLVELDRLAGFFCTAHHECVDQHDDEYSALEVHAARRALAAADAAHARLDKLKQLQKRAKTSLAR